MSAGNRDQTQPMIYASKADHATLEYGNVEEMLQKTDSYMRDDLKTYVNPPSGIQKLTKTILTTPETAKSGNNLKLLKQMKEVEIKAEKKSIWP